MDQTDFLISQFRRYYTSEKRVHANELSKREIGYIPFQGTMIRHIMIEDDPSGSALRTFLKERVPRHLYHSVATYEHPGNRSMKDKGWLGAELIFDLDADHLKDAEKMSYAQILSEVKKHTERLIEKFLIGYLNIDITNLSLYFSGGRGYHVHVNNDAMYSMNSDQRREISNLVRGEGLTAKGLIEVVSKEHFFGKGWIPEIDNAFVENFKEILSGGNPIKDEKLCNRIRQYFQNDPNERKDERKRILLTPGHEKYKKLINDEISLLDKIIIQMKEKFACEIDEPVSTDIHRLIRFPYSLHGKTGFQVVNVEIDRFKDFEPLNDAIPEEFKKDEIKINVTRPFEIGLNNINFKLDGSEVVPAYTAIYAILSGRANLE
ncbi:DNA primase catalytic subunit PriS [Cuniculiplasma sp. SKW4]|uniref:DNA primase catalytic subunit PriS n=1 Tax=Cuniculiplasma sp. SKW4 TaxID=3400171 RepID=UPI003FD047C4